MELFAYLNWTVSPEIFKIGFISIRWYSLMFALSFVIGYMIMSRIFRIEHKREKDLEALTIIMVLGTVIGARLGHCLFYDPEFYLSHPFDILKVWEGGLASHGAAIGIIIALWFYVKKRPYISFLWVIDRVVIVVALAGVFIRLGNFFNHEILGNPSNLPWAVVFNKYAGHELIGHTIPLHPVQLYESFSYLFIFILLILRYEKLKEKLASGELFGIFLILVFGARFILEYFKENQASFETSLPIHMGQILSIPFVIAGIYFLIMSRRKTVIIPDAKQKSKK